jgi:23S rRNA pseudouridine2605 synthase
MAEERLQKILSRAGIASRRKAEQMILEGRVSVNGQVVTELGSKADLDRDHVKADGKLLHAPKRLVYLALNKPDGYVTTTSDPQGRPTVMDLIKGVRERVYPVGRLDYHSEGLLLLTNDGEMANALMSAGSHVQKTYVVKVNGALSSVDEEKFRKGVPLMGRRTAPAGLKLIKPGENPWYEVRLIEGRNNQIRLMFQHFGRLVEKLRRVRVGHVDLSGLPPGHFRHLEPAEVLRFRKLSASKRTSDERDS